MTSYQNFKVKKLCEKKKNLNNNQKGSIISSSCFFQFFSILTARSQIF